MDPTQWWRGAVIYQIYPRSFFDSNGDGVGDLEGIRRKIDYVAALGVDGIWLSPFFKSPMKDFGYDVQDYRAVDPIFGSNEDFDRLVDAAHERGLHVIVDLVFSHSSNQHPWFLESRASRDNAKADWYVWADARPDGSPPNNWRSIFGGSAWRWEARRKQYYLHNFLVEQPDLNLHNPDVQDAVLDVARYWLGKGGDGFRLDVANFYTHDMQLRDNPPAHWDPNGPFDEIPANPYEMQRHLHDKSQPETLDFIRRLRNLLDERPGAMAVGEIADDDPVGRMAEYIGKGLLHTAYSFALLTTEGGASAIRKALIEFEATPGGGWPSWAMSNHDVIRVVTRWGGGGPNPELAKALLAALFCLRGVAFLYQGEELGLTEADVPYERIQDPPAKYFWPEYKGRDGCRTPMPWDADAAHLGFSDAEPWLPAFEGHRPLAVSVQDKDPGSTLNFVRGFLKWRKAHLALHGGDIAFHPSPTDVLCFSRVTGEGRVACAFNIGAEPSAVDLPFEVEDMPGHGLAYERDGSRVKLPPYGGYLGKS